MLGALGGQKRALDLLEVALTNGCELPFECWESNSGAEEEQPVLLTTQSSLWSMAQLLLFSK